MTSGKSQKVIVPQCPPKSKAGVNDGGSPSAFSEEDVSTAL